MTARRICRSALLPIVAVAAVVVAGCSRHTTHAVADDWTAVVAQPAFPTGQGPVVLVDAAHGNWHTIDGRFRPFAQLLEKDGYRVRGANSKVSAQSLAGVSIFVIANAVKGGEEAVWALPTPPALEPDETRALVAWVEAGGSLLLIADHMPFPGSVAELAGAFGLQFQNGFAVKSATEGGTLIFTRAGGLMDHAITRGRNASEGVPAVKSFTGQAFGATRPVQALMRMPEDWHVLLPNEAWKFEENTARVSTRGLVQGAVFEHGNGRVAAFGEAAMFTAQAMARDGHTLRVGMSDPEAPHNAQFVLNVAHWLSRLLD